MAVDASPYAVLGLKPGAEWAAVERAYKVLIKTYHPDLPGGDADRAAEINRAYRELRRERHASEENGAWDQREAMDDPPAPRRRWLPAAGAIAAGALLLVLLDGPSRSLVEDFRMRAAPLAVDRVSRSADTAVPDVMAQPVDDAAIRAGVADATRAIATHDEAGMAEAARKCHADLSLQPSLAGLDRCAAFDDAIAQLEDRDPWGDDGPFSQLAITSRETSAANLFSNDYLAIDGRLDRIRVAVELALAPSDPGPPAQAAAN